MKQRLSEVPKEDLKPGMKLKSAVGIPGEIISIDETTREDWTIWVKWENGHESGFWHFWGYLVEVVNDEEEKEI